MTTSISRRLNAALLGLLALGLPLAAAQTVRSQGIVVDPVSRLTPGSITFTLIDADSDRPVPGYDPIAPGATLDLARLPQRLAIRANPDARVGSVRFTLDGNANYRVQGGAPYALCNDQGGNYEPCPAAVFSVGTHRVGAVPFAGGGASGAAGAASELSYTVVRSGAATPAPAYGVTSLTLINADTNQPVAGFDPIPAGARLRLSALPPRLSMRANTSGNVRSVRFTATGRSPYLENEAPFALCGDTKFSGGAGAGRKGDFLVCNGATFTPGNRQVTVTPYTEMFGKGTAGGTFALNFTVER